MDKNIYRLRKLYQQTHIPTRITIILFAVCVMTALAHVGMSLILEPMISNSLSAVSIAWFDASMFLICSILFILLKFLRKVLFSAACCKSELELNRIAMSWFNIKGMQILEATNEGQIAAILGKRIGDFREFLEGNLETILYIPLDFLLTFIGILVIDYRTGLILIPVIICGVFIDACLSDRLVKSSEEAYNAENKVFSFQKEAVENEEHITLSGMTQYITDKHAALIKAKLKADNRLTSEQQHSYIPALINEYMPTIALISIAIFKMFHGGMAYGRFFALLSLISGASLPFADFLRSLSKLKAIDPLLEDISRLAIHEEKVDIPSKMASNSMAGKPVVNIRNLVFQYKQAERPVLSDINLSICEGDKIALIGRSGIGKTTFLKLILGILSPSKGKVEIFGEPVAASPETIWKRIGYVDNNCYLFDGTVAYNITLKEGELSNEQKCYLRQICTRLNIRDLLENMTPVQQFGNNLSGGQRLKICLARALFCKPELLILDEPTASFDAESESALCGILNDSSITAIISTHRKPLLKICNKIFQIEDGNLAQIKLGSNYN